MSKEFKEKFLKAIKETFYAYNKYGARSNKKLIPIHLWIANQIISGLGKDYSVRSLGHHGEYKIKGKYYTKVVDITIFKNKKQGQEPIVTASFKFVTSNYAQNSNNYFENLLGETANIKRVNVGFAHFLLLRGRTPYYDKAAGNKRGKLKKLEILSEHHIKKYIYLFKDLDFPHKPDVLGMAVIDFDKEGKPSFSDLEKLKLEEDTIEMLKNDFSIEKFIEKTKALCKIKS